MSYEDPFDRIQDEDDEHSHPSITHPQHSRNHSRHSTSNGYHTTSPIDTRSPPSLRYIYPPIYNPVDCIQPHTFIPCIPPTVYYQHNPQDHFQQLPYSSSSYSVPHANMNNNNNNNDSNSKPEPKPIGLRYGDSYQEVTAQHKGPQQRRSYGGQSRPHQSYHPDNRPRTVQITNNNNSSNNNNNHNQHRPSHSNSDSNSSNRDVTLASTKSSRFRRVSETDDSRKHPNIAALIDSKRSDFEQGSTGDSISMSELKQRQKRQSQQNQQRGGESNRKVSIREPPRKVTTASPPMHPQRQQLFRQDLQQQQQQYQQQHYHHPQQPQQQQQFQQFQQPQQQNQFQQPQPRPQSQPPPRPLSQKDRQDSTMIVLSDGEEDTRSPRDRRNSGEKQPAKKKKYAGTDTDTDSDGAFQTMAPKSKRVDKLKPRSNPQPPRAADKSNVDVSKSYRLRKDDEVKSDVTVEKSDEVKSVVKVKKPHRLRIDGEIKSIIFEPGDPLSFHSDQVLIGDKMFYRTDPNDPGILVEFLSDRRLIIFIDDANWISFTTVDRYIYYSVNVEPYILVLKPLGISPAMPAHFNPLVGGRNHVAICIKGIDVMQHPFWMKTPDYMRHTQLQEMHATHNLFLEFAPKFTRPPPVATRQPPLKKSSAELRIKSAAFTGIPTAPRTASASAPTSTYFNKPRRESDTASVRTRRKRGLSDDSSEEEAHRTRSTRSAKTPQPVKTEFVELSSSPTGDEKSSPEDIISPLTTTRRRQTRSMTSNGAELDSNKTLLIYPPGRSAVTVTVSDVARLSDGEFLNDTLIEFYLRHLTYRVLPESIVKQVHVFNSFLYQQLTNKDSVMHKTLETRYERVRRWTSKLDIFKKRFLIVPINEHAHWYLAVIYNPGALVGTPWTPKMLEDSPAPNDASASTTTPVPKDENESSTTTPMEANASTSTTTTTTTTPILQEPTDAKREEAPTANDAPANDQSDTSTLSTLNVSASSQVVFNSPLKMNPLSAMPQEAETPNGEEEPVVEEIPDSQELLFSTDLMAGVVENSVSAEQAVDNVSASENNTSEDVLQTTPIIQPIVETVWTKVDDGNGGMMLVSSPAKSLREDAMQVDTSEVIEDVVSGEEEQEKTELSAVSSAVVSSDVVVETSNDTVESTQDGTTQEDTTTTSVKDQDVAMESTPQTPSKEDQPKPGTPKSTTAALAIDLDDEAAVEEFIQSSSRTESQPPSTKRTRLSNGVMTRPKVIYGVNTPVTMAPPPPRKAAQKAATNILQQAKTTNLWIKEAKSKSGLVDLEASPATPPTKGLRRSQTAVVKSDDDSDAFPSPSVKSKEAQLKEKATKNDDPIVTDDDDVFDFGSSPRRNLRRKGIMTNDERREKEQAETKERLEQSWIFIFDSLATTGRASATKNLTKYLELEAKEKLGVDLKERPSGTFAKVPKQPNSWDCGVFLIHYVETFLSDPDKYLPLLVNKLDAKDEWFPIKEVTAKRGKIRKLIGDLHKEYLTEKEVEKELKRMKEEAEKKAKAEAEAKEEETKDISAPDSNEVKKDEEKESEAKGEEKEGEAKDEEAKVEEPSQVAEEEKKSDDAEKISDCVQENVDAKAEVSSMVTVAETSGDVSPLDAPLPTSNVTDAMEVDESPEGEDIVMMT